MKAIYRENYCEMDDLKVSEVAIPTPNENQILVRVHAASISRTDCAHVGGRPLVMRLFIGFSKPKIQMTGTDFAGVVESVGSKVKDFKKGDKIFGFNDEGLGSHAQYFVINQSEAIAKIPDNYSFEQAAASLEGPHYAYNFLNKVKTLKGKKILVYGATGGIGSAMVQMLKYQGVEVDAVANTKNMEVIKALGPGHVFNYEKEDFTETKNKYDIVFDAVGKSSFGACKPLLNKKGVYISSELGDWSQNIFYSLFAPILSIFSNGKKVLFPLPNNVKRSLDFMIEIIEAGQFSPLIDKTYEMHEIAEAFKFVDSGQKTGNVILNLK